MNVEELMPILLGYERRLATITDQVQEARNQAQHTLDRLNRLRRDLELFRQHLMTTGDTVEFVPGQDETPPP
jgi:hypothetical protein